MPITGSDRYRAGKAGIEGFGARTRITDEKIASSLRDQLAQKDKAATLQSSTRLGVAGIQAKTSLERERVSQEGQTSRQRLTSAGDVVLREMISSAGMERQKASDVAALGRVKETGEQARLTETAGAEEQFEYDKSISQYLEGLKKKGRQPYQYNPIEEEDDIAQHLKLE